MLTFIIRFEQKGSSFSTGPHCGATKKETAHTTMNVQQKLKRNNNSEFTAITANPFEKQQTKAMLIC